MAIIFSDIETDIITFLKAALIARSEAYAADVYVSVKKAPTGITEPTRQVIITGAPGRETNIAVRDYTLTIDVYASTYSDANNLSLLVEALMHDVTSVSSIKRIETTIGPVRTAEPSTSEKRSISFDLVVKGSNL